MRLLHAFVCLVATTATLLNSGSALASIVYANMTSMTTASYRMGANTTSSLEFGDQVLLAGTARQVTQIRSILQVQGGGTGLFDFNLTVGFRPLIPGGVSPGLGALLAPAQTYTFSGLANGGANAAAYGITLNLPTPITVPDQLAVMFSLSRNAGSNQQGVGFQFSASSTVGSSDPTFFWRESVAGSGVYQAFSFGGTNSNLALELTAVPEPSALCLLALAVSGMAAARRRKV